MNITDARKALPALADLTDTEFVESAQRLYYPTVPVETLAKELGVKIEAPVVPPPERTLMGTVGDIGLSALKGAVQVPQAAVGLADMVTGGQVGKTLEDVGYRPDDATAFLDSKKSDAQKYADKQVQQAGSDEGLWSDVWEKTRAVLRNPSVVGHSVIESLPSMGAGGVIARGAGGLLQRAAPQVAEAMRVAGAAPFVASEAALGTAGRVPLYLGAMGEGVVAAGSAAEQIRAGNKDRLLGGEQSALAAGSGAATALFGIIGGKIANRLGIADVDTVLAGAAANPRAAKGVTRQILEGFVSEGALEELPQSISEQVAQNLALGKPIDEGVNAAAVMGFFSGGLMGGAFNGYRALKQPPAVTTPPGGAPPATAPGATPPAGPAGTPAVTTGMIGALAAQNAPKAPVPPADNPAAVAGSILGQPTVDAAIAEAERQLNVDAGTTAGTIDSAIGLENMHRTAAKEANEQRTREPLELPRAKPTLPALDEVIQGGDILTPGTGAPLTAHAAQLKLQMLRAQKDKDGNPKDGQLIEVAEGGFILRPIRKGASNAPNGNLIAGTPVAASPAPAAVGGDAGAGNVPAGVGLPAGSASGAPAAGAAAPVANPAPAGTGQPAVPAAAAAPAATGTPAAPAVAPASVDGGLPGGQVGMVGAPAPAVAPAPPAEVSRITPREQGDNVEHETTSTVRNEVRPDGDAGTGVLPPVPRGEHAGLAQQAPDDSGAAGQGQRPELRGGVPETGQAGTPAVPVREPGLGNAPRGLHEAAGGNVDVPGMSPAGARDGNTGADSGTRADGSSSGRDSTGAQGGQNEAAQGAREGVTPGARWDAMTVEQRKELLSGKTAAKGKTADRVAAKPWAELEAGWHKTIERVMPAAGPESAAAPADEPTNPEQNQPPSAGPDDQPRDPESGQFVAEADAPAASANLTWGHATAAERRELLRAAGYTDADQARVLSGTSWHELTDTVRKALDKAPRTPKVTPQVPNEPGTKYVLPSFATGRGNAPAGPRVVVNKLGPDGLTDAERAAGKPSYADAPAAPKPDKAEIRPVRRPDGSVGYEAVPITPPAAAPAPAVSANTVFTDEMAEKARARLKAKLNRLGANIDPEMLLDGITLGGHYIEKGARTFAAYAKAMVGDLGNGIKPYLKSIYNALRDYPGLNSEGMSSAAMVAEFDLNDVSAPSDSDAPPKGDTGESDGSTAARELDNAGKGSPQGAPAQGVRAPDGGGPAGDAPAGRGRGNEPPAAAADGAGDDVGRGVGAGPRTAVPGGRAGRRSADGGAGRVPRASGTDAGAGRADDAGREGVAPNAAPVPAPQPTAEDVADFTIEDDLALGEGGQKTKFRGNVEAIRIAKDLQANPRGVTRDEQRALAKYVGWGGLAQAFDENNRDWTKEHAELKELLTDEEYAAARRSTRYAHYTSREIIVDGIYAALRRMGFNGGRVLEAGAGTGNFIGLMPADMRTAGRFTAVEREPLAATIAQALYPKQNVQLADFTEFRGTDGFYDAAVGNPPFAADSQVDLSGRKHLSGLSLHNYFFAKNVDMLREGGILAQVVTNYFMDAGTDKARKYISDRTRLLGAIRLPNNAFAKNANTEVTTDLIFLQKLPEAEWGGKKAREDAKRWLDTVAFHDPSRPNAKLQINRYFHANPDMMLGQFGAYGTMYGGDQPALIARPGQDTAALLREAVAKLPEAIYRSPAEVGTAAMEDAAAIALANPPVQEGGYFERDGKLIQRLQDIGGEALGKEITAKTLWTAKTTLGDAGFDKIVRLSRMRSTLRNLLAAEAAGKDGAATETLRKTLNTQYDEFVKEHGLINDRGTFRVFDDDPDFPLLLSLEHNYVPPIGPAEAKKMGIKPVKSKADKAPIFSRSVVDSRKPVERAQTPADALNISMAERGRLDAPYIAQLLGRENAEDTFKELASGDDPVLFMDPATNEYVLRDAYLSGNVRAKLTQAKAAGLHGNVRALEAVQPEDVPAHQITAKVGAPWIPTKVYESFAKDLLGSDVDVSIGYLKLNSSYSVHVEGATDLVQHNKWGTPNYKASELLAALLNNRTIKVTYTDQDGKTHTNVEATEAANVKAQEIRDRFGDWLMADPERSELLVRAYNDTNNNYVVRNFDGAWMRFPGKVPDEVIRFRKHQRDVVARAVQERTVLMDHVVGAGKTFAIVAAAMELRRTGLARKPMVTVPNHLVKQWAADFYRLYPGANILTATKKDFEKVNRRRFLAKIATGDWDAVVMAHSTFGFIQPGAEFEAEFNQRQIDLIMAAAADVQGMDAPEQVKKRTVKQLEGMAERLEKRIKRLRDRPIDDLLDFEELGIDQLFVDEAHMFKNLMFTTKLQNVAGLGDAQGSQRAYDMYVKTQQIMEKNGRDQGVIFATGTPVSNSLAEKYHMMRYLMPSTMKDMGFESFDAWANTFAEVTQVWMQKASGDGFKAQNRMSTFTNVPELLKLFDQVADTVTIEDIKRAYREENDGAEFPIPPQKTGRRIPVSLEKTAAQEAYMQALAARAAIVEARKGPPKKGEDNILVIMTDGRKAAMDIRLVDPDVIEREKGGRIDRAAAEVMDRYTKYADVKGAQLVFSDLGTPIKHARAELKEYEALKVRIDLGNDDDVRAKSLLGDAEALALVADAEDAEVELDAKGQDWLGAVKAALRGFSVYDDMRAALIERGIPEHEIAFIHDYNTDEQKAGLFRKVNAGDIRVVLGSTAKMGAGTNVQERLVAEHHLDVPWRPSDVEQREGRILRQGNKLLDLVPGFEVEILAYVTKDTLDMRMWQIQEVKIKLINQLRTRQIDRDIENAFEDMEMSAGEMQAAATGNMDLLREIQVRNDIKKLEQKKRSFEAQRNDLVSRRKRVAQRVRELPAQIAESEEAEKYADEYKAAIEAARAEFKVEIDGKEYTDAAEASKFLLAKTEARYYVRTVEKDGKKVREELQPEEVEAKAPALWARLQEDKKPTARWKGNDKPEPLPEGWDEKAAPLDVTMNGKAYTARAALAEAFSALRGDAHGFLWSFDGQKYARLTAASVAARQATADAVMDEKETKLGKFGPFELTIEGQPVRQLEVGTLRSPKKLDMRMTEAVLRAGKVVISGTFNAEANADAAAIASQVLDWASDRAKRAGGDLFYLRNDLEAAKRQKEELDRTEELGEWPGMSQLEETRAKHADILKRLGKAKAGDAPAMRQTDTPAATPARADTLQRLLDSVSEEWARPVPVTVFGNIDTAGVPASVREENARRVAAGKGSAKAVFFGGRMLMFADKIGSEQDALVSLYHEVLGHAGLRGHFGAEFDRVLNQVQLLRREDVQKMMERTGIKDPREAAEEVLAYLAQTKPELTLVQRAIAAIRAFLRDHMPTVFGSMKLSDAELVRDFILPARRHIEGGGPRGGGMPIGAAAQQQGAAPFYSALVKGIEGVSAKALPVEGWKGAINQLVNNGKAKADEVEWSGLREWLAMQQGKVSKEQVLEYLRAGGVQVQEVLKGQTSEQDGLATLRARRDGVNVELTALGWEIRTEFGDAILHNNRNGMDYAWDDGEFVDEDGEAVPSTAGVHDLAMEYGRLTDQIDSIGEGYARDTSDTLFGPDRHPTLSLPGGANYREVLLTLPAKPRITDNGDGTVTRSGYEGNVYTSSHWSEQNILAHIRVNDRTDADGKRVLFVEEVQSDFAQDMRKSRTAQSKAVDNDFEGIVNRMKAAGVLKVECD